MKKGLSITILFLSTILSMPTQAQYRVVERPIQMSFSFGVGGGGVLDTYLSPYTYTGTNLILFGERTRYFKGNEGRLLGQHALSLEFLTSTYGGGSGRCYFGALDYSYSIFYRMIAQPTFDLFVGGGSTFMGGSVYNVRNSNNPATAKLSLDANISAMAQYRLKIGNYPLLLRYHVSVPFMGAFFTPEYGQSYYEIFVLGNTDGIIHFSSFHNHLAIKNHFSVDLPIKRGAIRLGYWNSINQFKGHDLTTRFVSNNFTIGYVLEFTLSK